MKSEKGVTLIEAMMALTVLAIAVAGTITAVLTASMSNTISREYARAYERAQEVIAEIRSTASTNFGGIVSTYDQKEFVVEFYRGQDDRCPNCGEPASVVDITCKKCSESLQGGPRMGIPKGGVPSKEGYVVIVNEEAPYIRSDNRADYGRDLEPADGVKDGIALGDKQDPDGPFPLDLNADGDTDDVVADPIIPVFVIVRWRTVGRPGSNRVQLCTFIAREK